MTNVQFLIRTLANTLRGSIFVMVASPALTQLLEMLVSSALPPKPSIRNMSDVQFFVP